ncbi:probable ubiquitin-like-specific protease 2a [Phtheirospermum japonicum]|uniref:Probable ubiquitin-like-specific protease 2a n=1 Tax=Phtheirospermum japonicum TaxID=374723 RepID=A0A830BIW9_9LAMI|nr:probable ubiquitin-like-specific protease 2a [Phtheirospermum japonicum]
MKTLFPHKNNNITLPRESPHIQYSPIRMGKRRSAEKKNYSRGEGNITSRKDYGGGSNNEEFSVFEFADDDLRVEAESRKSLAKFGTKSPNKKPSPHRQPVDKYLYLERFANGTTTQRNDTRIDVLDVDVADCASRNITSEKYMTLSPACSLNYDHSGSYVKHQGFECSSRRAKSCAPGNRKAGCYRTVKMHNNVLYVDSDEDGPMELRSSGSSFDIGENEGSIVQQSSEYGANNNDCEAVVVVAPHYVKYAKMHYTKCLLTFSQRCIRLEGPPLGERNRAYCLEWSTFDILEIEYQQCESVKADVVNLHFKPRDINVADSGNWNTDSVELEFVVLHDPQWSQNLEDIKSLDLKYKAAWKIITSECNFDESFEDIIYPDGDPDAVFISRKDIELLRPRTFINDTIIDFYIKYLVNKTNPEKQHMFHFFNTFFFQKLVDKGRDLSRTCEGSDAFQRVRKWTKNINIFEKDYVFIPSALEFDCYLPSRGNKGMDSSSKVPCILHMDSIRGSHGGLENLIRSYLWEEWKERGSKQEEDISSKFLNLDFIALQMASLKCLFTMDRVGVAMGRSGPKFFEAAMLEAQVRSNQCMSLANQANPGCRPNGPGQMIEILNLRVKLVNKGNQYIDALPQQENWFDCGLFLLHYAELFLEQAPNFGATKYVDFFNKDWFLAAEVSLKKRNHIRKLIHGIVKDNAQKDPPSTRENKHLQRNIDNSSDESEIKWQESFSSIFEQTNIDNSVIGERFQLVPDNQFNNMILPIKDAVWNQEATLPYTTSSGYEADGDDEPMPQCYPLPICGKAEVSRETCSSTSPIMIDVQNDNEDNDCVSEVACSMEGQRDRYSISSMSSEEDLEAIVVQDSEEESETESIRRTRHIPIS